MTIFGLYINKRVGIKCASTVKLVDHGLGFGRDVFFHKMEVATS